MKDRHYCVQCQNGWFVRKEYIKLREKEPEEDNLNPLDMIKAFKEAGLTPDKLCNAVYECSVCGWVAIE